MFIGTWNINGKKIKEDPYPWLVKGSPSGKPDADIYVIGFEEMVDLTAATVVLAMESEERSHQWVDKLQECLNKDGENYSYIDSIYLVGVFIGVYVKNELVDSITDIESVNTAVGLLGLMGNKGASCIRMTIKNTPMCFICSHLAADRKKVNERNANYHTIIDKTVFETVDEDGKNYKILDHDIVVWLGDLNYRITTDLSTEAVFERLEKHDMETLLAKDQLIVSKEAKLAFEDFREPHISFPPTYKYQPLTDKYEQRPEKPKRAPAWCDRIQWRCNHGADDTHMTSMEYGCSFDLKASDHKPVYCTTTVTIRNVIKQKMNEVRDSILRKMDSFENSQMPQIKVDKDVLNFSDVKYYEKTTQKVVIENVGNVAAKYHFVNKLEDPHFCKQWLKIEPAYGLILPGEKCELKITVFVDRNTAQDLNSGVDSLEDILILRTEKGRDFFISITGQYMKSCFGSTIDELIRTEGPVRFSPPVTLDMKPVLNIPKELYRIVDYIYQHGKTVKGLFTEHGSEEDSAAIREALDVSEDFPENVDVHAMADVLIEFLTSLNNYVVPWKVIPTKPVEPERMGFWSSDFCEDIPPTHYNVFLYIVIFLRELLSIEENELSSDIIAMIFANALMVPPSTSSTLSKEASRAQEIATSIVLFFITCEPEDFVPDE